MIGGLPGTLAFLNPWALTALLGLPVIYILLRITAGAQNYRVSGGAAAGRS